MSKAERNVTELFDNIVQFFTQVFLFVYCLSRKFLLSRGVQLNYVSKSVNLKLFRSFGNFTELFFLHF